MPTKYSIKDLERISGIKAHTLRIWEQRYSILRPERSTTNIRNYTDADLKRILNISLLNNNGFKISNIAKLTEDALLEQVNKFLNTSRRESDQIDTLVLCLMYLDEDRFELTLNNSVIQFGFENTIEKIVFPFLRQLGEMWQVNLVTPAQEHYISNLIRQKLIVGIDKLTPARNPHPKTFLFFLPEQELHELGLIYAHYLAKTRGHKCIYLGQSVPVDDLLLISKSVKPDHLVTILTSQMDAADVNALLANCHTKLPSANLYLSGRLVFAGNIQINQPSTRFKLFEDFSQFKELLSVS